MTESIIIFALLIFLIMGVFPAMLVWFLWR